MVQLCGSAFEEVCIVRASTVRGDMSQCAHVVVCGQHGNPFTLLVLWPGLMGKGAVPEWLTGRKGTSSSEYF